VVEVSDGFALNQLIPKRLAEAATPASLKRIQSRAASIAADNEVGQKRYADALTKLKETPLEIGAEANDQNHLFKAVSENEIAEAAKEAGIDIEAKMIVIGTPIKELGTHNIELAFGMEREKFPIEVTRK